MNGNSMGGKPPPKNMLVTANKKPVTITRFFSSITIDKSSDHDKQPKPSTTKFNMKLTHDEMGIEMNAAKKPAIII